MNTLMIVLRLIHILGGVLWVGTSLVNIFFLAPTAAATGDVGQKFMAHLIGKARLTQRVMLAAYLTVLSGAGLYWIDSQGFTSPWQESATGLGFGLGAVAAFVALGFGQILGQNAARIGRISGELQGAPSPQQAEELARARDRMSRAGTIGTALLVLALAFMATARYWSF